MKLKYYLRGLGIGIIVTAVIMGVASGNRKETLSDREIKERAAALGMIEQGTLLSDLEAPSASPEGEEDTLSSEEETKTPEPLEVQTAEPSAVPEESEAPSEEPVAAQTEEPAQTPAGESGKMQEAEEIPEADTEAQDGEEAAQDGEDGAEPAGTPAGEVTIQILSGEGSYTICRKLEDAGLIASASSFDAYLYTNGYDRKLCTGTYQVPVGAEPETIAAILTRAQ